MLDSVTKKRIDDLRNILVGKIPDPKSQVEQITTGLIYKFMHDMDEEAVEMGGVPSFFTDDFENRYIVISYTYFTDVSSIESKFFDPSFNFFQKYVKN